MTREISRALKATGHFSQGRVQVSATDGVVHLKGRVSSYYEKQVAQAAAMKIVGPGRLVNDVEVASGD